jgi:ribosomal protein L31
MNVPALVRDRRTYDIESPVYRDTQILLQSLGHTPRQVYRRLKDMKVWGTPGVECCPISRYLKSRLPLTVEVATDDHYLWIGSTRIVLPFAVEEFIRRFDNGRYRGVRSDIA